MTSGGVKVDVRVTETLRLEVPGQDGSTSTVAITVEHKSGQVARLRITAPLAIRIKHPRKAPELAPG